MDDRAFMPSRCILIAKMPLQHENLPQEFDVSPRQRKYAEPRAQLLRAAVMLIEQPERDQE